MFIVNVPKYRQRRDSERCQHVVEADIEARWVVQRDKYLHEEVEEALKKSLILSAPDDDILPLQEAVDAYKKELQRLNTEYRTYSRLLWKLRTRATSSSGMAWNKGYGHCTSACGCCIRAPGDSHSHSPGEGKVDKRTDLKDFPFDIVARDSKFSIRTLWAYIFWTEFLG